MKIPIYQIDAFTSRVLAGNPAAVCPLPSWLPDATLQAIAAENNLSETAFFVGRDGEYQLRWFTPLCEVDLCGHATLASAFVVLRHLEPARSSVRFSSPSGPLAVSRQQELLALDFPARPPGRGSVPAGIGAALGREPSEILLARDAMAVYGSEEEVRELEPDMARLSQLECFAVMATAPGREVDFVSRFFAPRAGVPEDPVTGSAHCTLVPYWSSRLGKTKLHARQVSKRGGELWCEDRGERVRIAGHAVQYLEGTIEI
jgi:predicted PhzF superfamily epimerase YddE/YHI9